MPHDAVNSRNSADDNDVDDVENYLWKVSVKTRYTLLLIEVYLAIKHSISCKPTYMFAGMRSYLSLTTLRLLIVHKHLYSRESQQGKRFLTCRKKAPF